MQILGKNSQKKLLLRQVIDFFMFVNLSIPHKFALFGTGVLFWFFALFVVSVSTLIVMRSQALDIVHELIPWEQTAAIVTMDFHKLIINSYEIAMTTKADDMVRKSNIAIAKLSEIRTILNTMQYGGDIHNFSYDNKTLKTSLKVPSVKEHPEGEHYVKSISTLTDRAEYKFREISALKLSLLSSANSSRNIDELRQELDSTLAEAVAVSEMFSTALSKKYAGNYRYISSGFAVTFFIVTAVTFVATLLLVLFTRWIALSITRPINSIIRQIRSLNEGDITSLKKIEVKTKDEMGILTSEFNGLMESISNLASFKKIVEEDDCVEDVYLRLAHKFIDEFGVKDIIFYEVVSGQNQMKVAYPLATLDTDIFCNQDVLSDSNLCRAKKTGHEVSSYDFPNICKSFRASEFNKDYRCMPLIMGGVTGGVVQFVFDKPQNPSLDLKEMEKMVFRARQYIDESVAVLDAKRLMNTLRDSALKDSLTGLYNRRFLQEYTESLVSGVIRREKQVGLIMCDLDYFKQVNDMYGHNTGDAVLKETAAIIGGSVRTSDLVIRFGGEEFLAILLDVKEGDTTRIAEKIRQSMQNSKIKVPDGIITKTISLGISEFPKDTNGFWQAIKYADVALYSAKETGRNKSVRFEAEMWREDQF